MGEWRAGPARERARLGRTSRVALVALLGVAVAVPGLTSAVQPGWVPDWMGAATAIVGLAAALVVCWRAGALRLRYVGLLAVAIALAALVGAFRRGV